MSPLIPLILSSPQLPLPKKTKDTMAKATKQIPQHQDASASKAAIVTSTEKIFVCKTAKQSHS